MLQIFIFKASVIGHDSFHEAYDDKFIFKASVIFIFKETFSLQLFAVLPELYNLQSHDSFHEAYDDRFIVC
jgi:hypothetical protein